MKTDKELLDLVKRMNLDAIKNPEGKYFSPELENEIASLEYTDRIRLKLLIKELASTSKSRSYRFFAPLLACDRKILSFCTKLSHWLQRTFGITNYFIAKIGCTIAAIGQAMSIINRFHRIFTHETTLLILSLSWMWLFILIYRSFICTKAEEHLLSGKITKPQEILAYDAVAGRIFMLIVFIIFLPADLIEIFHSKREIFDAIDRFSYICGILIFLYFIVVNSLPPGISKVKAWIRNLFTVMHPAKESS